MILKQSDERRSDLAELTRLASRCDQAQKRRLDSEYKKLTVGIRGERDAARVMNRVYGECDRIGLLHDVRIGIRGEYAQIDHLVVHRIQGRIWLCETKNYGGRLQCNEHGEWTVWYGRRPQPIPSPIEQARLQAIVLERWLDANGYGFLKVLPLVLVAPTSGIDRRKLPSDVTVVQWDQFGDWWDRQAEDLTFLSALKMAAGALRDQRGLAWLREFGEALCSAHEPISYDWEQRLGLSCATEFDAQDTAGSNIHALPVPKASRSDASASPDKLHLDLCPLTTAYGDITFIALGDAEIAIRHPPTDPLIEVVRGTVKGRARWQPRYRNWIVKAEIFADVRAQIEARLAEQAGRRRA